MTHTISLWLSLPAFALLSAMAQQPQQPTFTGAPQAGATANNSSNGPSKYNFTVFNSIGSVKAAPGQNVEMAQNDAAGKLPVDQQKQKEQKTNEAVVNIQGDLSAVTRDVKDADGARAAAAQSLGAGASKADLDAKEAAIKAAKYGEIETLMLKDTKARPDVSILWAQLGVAEAGLKKYDDAETAFQKALDVENTAKKPNPTILGLAEAGLGESYARTGKVPEAQAAYDAAAKVYPIHAGLYLRNEAVIFFQLNNPEAQAAAADKAIKIDPNQPILYYLKGNGLDRKSSIDAKTQQRIPPPGCVEAYRKYLELAPNGPFAEAVKGILASFGANSN